VVDDTRAGRHRNAARYSPAAELSTIVRSVGGTSVKASAVLAASGGLVAAFALPAQAAPTRSSAATSASAATSSAAPAELVLAPAVVAPETAAPVVVEAVGVVGVEAVAKPTPTPRPTPRPEPVARAVANRSSDSGRASRTSTRYTNPEQSVSGVVNIARTLLGIPYAYGGTSPSGFDCSGFTQYVFGKAGVSIPRTASGQKKAATPVGNPKPGDLVFFGSPVWHVGIYTGNGMMIDSPRPGKSTQERHVFSGVSGYGRL
jgi:cell wall-associated NlpC family hydrolase